VGRFDICGHRLARECVRVRTDPFSSSTEYELENSALGVRLVAGGSIRPCKPSRGRKKGAAAWERPSTQSSIRTFFEACSIQDLTLSQYPGEPGHSEYGYAEIAGCLSATVRLSLLGLGLVFLPEFPIERLGYFSTSESFVKESELLLRRQALGLRRRCWRRRGDCGLS